DSRTTQVGDWVLAIGSPFGLEQTVTAGIISSKDRRTPYASNFQHFLQTDAAINRGNSGGPLVNMHGEVIGVNSQIATYTGDSNGVGFALPSKEAEFVFDQIQTKGKVSRGYLGVYLDPVKREYATVYGLTDTKGVIVTDVRDYKSPAAVAGIKPNDIIVEVNGQSIEDPQDLISRVSVIPVGQQVQLTYLRDTGNRFERHAVNVTVGERPKSAEILPRTNALKGNDTSSSDKKDPSVNKVQLGITLTELTPQLANDKKLVGIRGLLVKDIDPNGIIADLPQSQTRLNKEEVIVKINRVNVNTLADFERIANSLKQGDPVVLIVNTPNDGQITQKIIQFTFQ
ncbi:MAG: PDZ domain-containing protein, partial [Pyrinomonadaceae bacterium]